MVTWGRNLDIKFVKLSIPWFQHFDGYITIESKNILDKTRMAPYSKVVIYVVVVQVFILSNGIIEKLMHLKLNLNWPLIKLADMILSISSISNY